MRATLSESAGIAVITLFLAGCGSTSSPESNAVAVPADFLVGGQVPFWLIAGEAGTPSDTPAAEIARQAIIPRAKEMFDVVIPSAITWNWTEEQQGVLDYHRYEWANNWAIQEGKDTLVQHIFWAWADSKPLWVQALDDDELRAAMFNHIQDVHNQVGDVARITVINEMTCKTYLQDRLGPGITKEIFAKTREVFPNTELFVNEHACPDADPKTPGLIQKTMDNYATLIQKLRDDQVDFDRVGLQSYFTDVDVELQGGTTAFVENYNNAVNSFTRKTGYKIIITELGFASPDEDFRANFLRAFFAMVVSNPNIEGLLIFHWLDDQDMGTALVNRDGSLTKAGEVFYQVFRK